LNGSGVWHAEEAWLGRRAEGVLIEVADGRITSVTEGVAARSDAARLKGWTIPGLANVHSHAFQHRLRGTTESGAGDFWEWRKEMYRGAASWEPDEYREYATAVFKEMLAAGITAVGEFHYLHRYGNRFGEALIAAAQRAGIRITLIDACYLRGGLDGRPLDSVQQTFSDGDAERWAKRVDELQEGMGVRIGAAIHSVRAVDPRSMVIVAAWARKRKAPLHIHLAEQAAEVEDCLAVERCRPAQVLEREGILGPDLTAIHAIQVDEREISLLGRHNVAVCACPTSERDLGDRVGPTRNLVDAGTALCVGSDSNAVIDMLEEARAVELDQRRATGRRVLHQPDVLLHAATAGGMRALGWEAGEIKAGMLADFVTIARVEGKPLDPGQLVFCRSACDVTNVVVGGKTVVSN
jgi:formiminoglutamate deiminase